jgi:four helix bundle protein
MIKNVKQMPTDKEIFIDEMKLRTKNFAADIIRFVEALRICKASTVITYQLVKSATSVGANYRAACRARSQAEFFSKVCIVVEEADEAEYWLELIKDTNLTDNLTELDRLTLEIGILTKIMAKAKNSTYK